MTSRLALPRPVRPRLAPTRVDGVAAGARSPAPRLARSSRWRTTTAAVVVTGGLVVAATACGTADAPASGPVAATGTTGTTTVVGTTETTELVAATTTNLPETTTTAPTTTVAPTTTAPPPPPTTAAAAVLPGRLAPPGPIPTATPGTGQWTPIGPPVGGQPGMYATALPTSSGSIVGVAWIDPAAFTARLYPGTADPGGAWPYPGGNVGPEMQPALGAVFNGGFKMKDSRGGYYLDGRQTFPLRDGAASLVVFNDGKVTVGAWGRDVGLFPNVVAVRQNLDLLVDGGVVSPSATERDISVWGATLNRVTAPPRSGVGVRADGALVYVGGPGLSARGLGDALVAAGAVRGMTLDINNQWVTYNWFTHGPGGLEPHKLIDTMTQSPRRFVDPDSRDFVALFAR